MDEATSIRFAAWLQGRGIEGGRRVVRESPDGILVSKFEPGFAARLHDAVDRVPELFDESLITERYLAFEAAMPRVEGWRLAVRALLKDLAPGREISQDQLDEIQAGVDSVAALLDSALWTGPTLGADWTASDAERTAVEEAAARMDDESSIFTRYYGDFEGLAVRNHCPGSQLARRLFAQAWSVVGVSGASPPAPLHRGWRGETKDS